MSHCRNKWTVKGPYRYYKTSWQIWPFFKMENSWGWDQWWLLSNQSFPQTCKKICWSLSIQFLYHGVNTLVPSVSHRTKCSVKIMIKRWKGGTKLKQCYRRIFLLQKTITFLTKRPQRHSCSTWSSWCMTNFPKSIHAVSLETQTSANMSVSFFSVHEQL